MRRLLCALVLVAVIPCVGAWTWPVRGPVLQTFSFDPAHPYAAGEHRGIAIGAGSGTPVVAPASGTVTFAGSVPTNGRSVTILTPSGLAVSLTHLGSIAVAQNAGVAEGDLVGTVGPSGTPELDVPYVHLGIRQASNDQGYLDPLGFLPVVATPPQAPAPPAPAPAPAPAPPPAVAAPQPAAQPAAQPSPAPVSAPAPQLAPVSAPAPAPAAASDARGQPAPGVTVAAPRTAEAGIAVHAPPQAPATARASARVVAPAPMTRPEVVPPSSVLHPEPASRRLAAPSGSAAPVSARRSVPDAGSWGIAVPAAARPLAAPSHALGVHAGTVHAGLLQLVIGVGALVAAALVALVWLRRRLAPRDGRERTALV